jgi:hypothetical protein
MSEEQSKLGVCENVAHPGMGSFIICSLQMLLRGWVEGIIWHLRNTREMHNKILLGNLEREAPQEDLQL